MLGSVLSSAVYLTKEVIQTCVAYSPENLASLPAQRFEQAVEDRKIFLCPKAYHIFLNELFYVFGNFLCLCDEAIVKHSQRFSLSFV